MASRSSASWCSGAMALGHVAAEERRDEGRGDHGWHSPSPPSPAAHPQCTPPGGARARHLITLLQFTAQRRALPGPGLTCPQGGSLCCAARVGQRKGPGTPLLTTNCRPGKPRKGPDSLHSLLRSQLRYAGESIWVALLVVHLPMKWLCSCWWGRGERDASKGNGAEEDLGVGPALMSASYCRVVLGRLESGSGAAGA